MAANSAIQWTTHTFNPWRGCTKVHAGCTNCYAESNMSVKMHGIKWGPSGTRVRASDAMWKEPLKWNREAEKAGERRRVFCASLADVFEDWQGPVLDHHGKTILQCDSCINPDGSYYRESVPSFDRMKKNYEHGCGEQARHLDLDDLRRDLFTLIDNTASLDWLLLTKRPENVRKFWWPPNPRCDGGLRSNVWLGTSISDQATADKWIPRLLECRDLCPVLFASAEPLIGAMYLEEYLWSEVGGRSAYLDWLIVGGESGHNARPCNVEWIRSIVSQCKAAGVPRFVKQLGSNCVVDRNDEIGGGIHALLKKKLADKKGGDMDEWPEDLRVREFPQVTTAAREP